MHRLTLPCSASGRLLPRRFGSVHPLGLRRGRKPVVGAAAVGHDRVYLRPDGPDAHSRLDELQVAVKAAQEALEQANLELGVGRGTTLERVVAQDQVLTAELALYTAFSYKPLPVTDAEVDAVTATTEMLVVPGAVPP